MPRLYLRMPKSMVTKYVTSFLGFMDIKVGCQIISLFSLFNKIAGVYGIMAMFQGGSFSQLSLYLSLIHISEPTRRLSRSRMPSSA